MKYITIKLTEAQLDYILNVLMDVRPSSWSNKTDTEQAQYAFSIRIEDNIRKELVEAKN